MHKNIFLVGLMGSGKTTVGRALAKALGWSFVDSDHEIQTKTGVPISAIFDIEGEEKFREREACVIDDVTKKTGIVLATGGGAILSETTRELLKKRGTVVYLRAHPARLFERTRYDKTRPLLQADNPLAILEALNKARDPLYQATAHLVVETGSMSLSQLIKSILTQLKIQHNLI